MTDISGANSENAGTVALITGANKGIGREIARQLGARGITVLLGARDARRGEEAAAELRAGGADAHPVLLEVTDDASVQAAVATVTKEYGRLDILVNNAGIAIDDAPASQVSPDILRRTYDTNVFGLVAVTQAFLPLLKNSPAGRIVNLSSGLGSLTLNSDPNWDFAGVKPLAYNSSKAAVNMITVVFAAELAGTTIKVNAADPGYTATDMNRNQGTQTIEEGAQEAVRLATLPGDGPTGGYYDKEGVQPW